MQQSSSREIADRGGTVHIPPDPPDSTGVWHRAWPESQDELAALVEAYVDRLVRYAFRQVGNLEDAEDVVQEVFVRAFGDRTTRKNISAVGPYLYRAVANACTDLLRRRNYSATFREEIEAEQLLRGQDNPAEAAQAAEGLRRAEQLLSRLPEEQAQVVRLRVLDGLRLSEIADVVGCSINTVCSRLRYGFKKLRALVAEKRE